MSAYYMIYNTLVMYNWESIWYIRDIFVFSFCLPRSNGKKRRALQIPVSQIKTKSVKVNPFNPSKVSKYDQSFPINRFRPSQTTASH